MFKKINLPDALTGFVFLVATIVVIINYLLLPLGSGRDELELLQVIDFYHDQKRFPVLPDDWADSSWSAHHPPLYFMLTAALIELGLPDPDSHSYIRNPFHNSDFYPATYYNRVPIVTEQGWNKTQTWYFLRLLSIVFHGVAALAFWRAARLFFNENWQIGVPLAVALFILAPVYLQFAVVLNNDALLIMLSSLIFWLLARTMRFGFRWRTSAAMGVLLGLGLLTKIFIFPVVVVIPFVFLWHGREQRGAALRHLMMVVILSGLISGWWYIRNYTLYGEFTAASVNEALVKTRRTTPISWGELRGFLTLWPGELWLEAHLVTPVTSTWSYVVGRIGLGILMLGVLGAIVGRWRQAAVRGHVVCVFAPVLAGILFMTYGATRNIHGGSTTVMRAALPALCLLFSLAIITWLPKRDYMVGIIVIGLVLFLAFFQVAFFLSRYAPVGVTSAAEIKVAHELNIDFENGVRLLGYELEERHLQPGDVTRVRLCWEARQGLDNSQNYAFTVQLVLPEHPAAAHINAYHASGRFPTSIWTDGDAFCEWVPLEIQQEAVVPRAYDLRIGLFLPDGADISYTTPEGELSHYLVVDKIGVTQPIDNDLSPVAQVDEWGALMDYQTQLEGGTFTLDLTWLAWRPTAVPYTYYLHVLDAEGNVVEQLDRPPMNGLFPTSFWQAGVLFTDTLSLEVPSEAARFRFGVYDPEFRRGIWKVDGGSVGDGLTVLDLAG